MHTRFHFISRLLQITGICVALASCGEQEYPDEGLDPKLLATDVHVRIGQHALVLPLISLEHYTRNGRLAYSLDKPSHRELAQSELDQLLRDSADPKHPLEFDSLTVAMQTGAPELCLLLTREWARAGCDNPWGPIHQALPYNRFSLVDLSRLRSEDPRGLVNCEDNGEPHRPLPKRIGEAELVCKVQVYGSGNNEYYRAVIRIDGDLGALWTVWRHGQEGETAATMAQREGKAIIALVQYGLVANENFPVLHSTLCRLRRPEAVDDPQGPRCRRYVESSG